MSTSSSKSITDPERIRALAHPLRLALLDHLEDAGEATATQCAHALGESVASCSFHLRMLAKYGFIERTADRGRERPWRAVDRGHYDATPDERVPGSLHAVRALAELSVQREMRRIAQFLESAESETQRWLLATTITRSSFWATAEEMASLSQAVQALTARFADRDEPAKRPLGARRGRLFAVVNPDPRRGEGEA